MYQPIYKKKGSKRGATLRATNSLRKYKEWISRELSALVPQELVDYFKQVSDASKLSSEVLGYDIDIKVSMPKDKFGFKNHKLKRRDVTNAIKATEDGFLEHMGLEDSYTGKCTIQKMYNNQGTWQIEFSMKPTKLWIEREIYNEQKFRTDYSGRSILSSESGYSSWGDVSE
ncbi:hypothetical protein LIS04_100 [Listeria phage LIS04]|nr:hypothetical protein LIS04_100 [Listeria phage LIS04]